MNADTIALITAEQERSRALHGGGSLANLPALANGHIEMLNHLHQAGAVARKLCELGPASKLAVLVEEVAEVAEDVLMNRDPVRRTQPRRSAQCRLRFRRTWLAATVRFGTR